MGRDFSQNKFDGTLGEELDRLWAAIKQDQILSSPSVQATRTPSGTTLNGAPKKAGGAVTNRGESLGQRWIIDGDGLLPSHLQVKSKALDPCALGMPLEIVTIIRPFLRLPMPPSIKRRQYWPGVNLLRPTGSKFLVAKLDHFPGYSREHHNISGATTMGERPWYTFPGGYRPPFRTVFRFSEEAGSPFLIKLGVNITPQVMNPQSGLLTNGQVANLNPNLPPYEMKLFVDIFNELVTSATVIFRYSFPTFSGRITLSLRSCCSSRLATSPTH